MLIFLEFIYFLLIKSRNILYDRKIPGIKKLDCPVISIGNITTGGTGKTPTAARLARILQDKGCRVVLLSRGYKSRVDRPAVVAAENKVKLSALQAGDEAYLLAHKLAGIPVVIGKNRYRAGKMAQRKFTPDVFILDDGYQHRSLYRDQDIVLIDALNPFGRNHLLPRGLLREPLNGLKRADLLIITRTRHVSKNRLSIIIQKLKEYNLRAPIIYGDFCSRRLKLLYRDKETESYGLLSAKKILSLDRLTDRKVMVISGIGNPHSFIRDLEKLRAEIEKKFIFPDHYRYTKKDIEQIIDQARLQETNWLLTTEKDAVRLTFSLRRMLQKEGIKLLALTGELVTEKPLVDYITTI